MFGRGAEVYTRVKDAIEWSQVCHVFLGMKSKESMMGDTRA